MKNVHVLPTEKPSRLYKDQNNVFKLDIEAYGSGSQYIYITSDEVKKHGDWVISNLNELTRFRSLYCQNEYRKIILTTDQDLFNDGIQSIDKEFLEWFIKNPSCESVDVKKGFTGGNNSWDYNFLGYKIIIPQEEPKQEWSPSQGEEVYLNVFSNWSKGVYIGYDVTKQAHIARDNSGYIILSSEILPYYAILNEPKQEMAGKAFYESADKVITVKRQERLKDIGLEEVFGSSHCEFSVIENNLAKLYRNQEKILKAIKLLRNDD